jgi:hypothetical protein
MLWFLFACVAQQEEQSCSFTQFGVHFYSPTLYNLSFSSKFPVSPSVVKTLSYEAYGSPSGLLIVEVMDIVE